MAFVNTNLHLLGHGGDNKVYYLDAVADTMVTVAAVGYINNSDDDVRLAVDDVIFAQCNDGDFWLRVSAVAAAGDVTWQPMSFEGPSRGVLGSASAALLMGVNEIGTGTGSAFVLPTPFIGAKITVVKTGSATAGESFITDAAGVTLDSAGDRTITLDAEGDNFTLLGISTTRWVILSGTGIVLS